MSLTKQRGELGSSGKISSSKTTSGTRCGAFVKNPVIIQEWEKWWNCDYE